MKLHRPLRWLLIVTADVELFKSGLFCTSSPSLLDSFFEISLETKQRRAAFVKMGTFTEDKRETRDL